MNSRRLRYFVAAADAENFGVAADKMHIARPALSRHIRDLELELGVQLFDRVGRGVRLSRAGAYYADRAREILTALDRAAEDVRRIASNKPTVRVGLLEFVGLHEKVVGALRSLRSEFPTCELLLKPMGSISQIRAIEAGAIDAGFIYNWFKSSDHLAGVTVAKDRWLLALSSSHPLSQRGSIKVADIVDEDFVSMDPTISPRLFEQLMSGCASQGLRPRIKEYAPSTSALFALVAAGAGICFTVELATPPQGVTVLPIEDLQVWVPVDFVWRTDETVPEIRRAIDIMVASFG